MTTTITEFARSRADKKNVQPTYTFLAKQISDYIIKMFYEDYPMERIGNSLRVSFLLTENQKKEFSNYSPLVIATEMDLRIMNEMEVLDFPFMFCDSVARVEDDKIIFDLTYTNSGAENDKEGID